MFQIALQHGSTWTDLSAGTTTLSFDPKPLSTTFSIGTFIKAVKIFANSELIGLEFLGTNSDASQCIGTCDSTNLKSTIAPGGVLNYINASVTNERWTSFKIYGFANITFNFLCTQMFN